jgi:hypothetical protein
MLVNWIQNEGKRKSNYLNSLYTCTYRYVANIFVIFSGLLYGGALRRMVGRFFTIKLGRIWKETVVT